ALEQQPTPGVPTVEPLESAALARTVPTPSASPPPGRRPDTAAVDAAAPTLAPSKRGAAPAEPADPELMKLFIEEAQEELARIQNFFAVWDHDPLERDALITVRRSFHTLKGSGRMVGARELSEFAWAIENLMNRVLDTTVTRTPAILETLRAGVAALPEVITQLQTREAPPTDDTLRDTYARETAAHVATVRGYLERESQLPEPHPLPEDVYRACHTLSGSSKMAQARHGIRLAEPLDRWLRRAFNSGLGLPDGALALLSDCMGAMESVASHLDEPTGYFVSHWQLLERIERADKALDQRIAASTAREGAAPPAPEPAAAGHAPPEEEVVDFDPEVAAIFTDEATELIEQSERALTDWRAEPRSAEFRLALKRPLHTLKGGARMAGITPMGDLSHELETLVLAVDNGT